MSKLTSLIEATQTGRVKPAVPGFKIRIEESLREANTHAKEYRLGVVLQMRGFASNGRELTHLKQTCARSVIEVVFGEFRTKIREIERSLYELDLEEARTLLQQLENEMFS